MFEDALPSLKTQVQTIERPIMLFQHIHHAQGLEVVLKAAVILHAIVQGILPRVAERRVPQVVSKGNGFDQVFVEAQVARNGTADLRDLQAVRQAGAEKITFMIDKNLGFIFESTEGCRMYDAIPITLERGTSYGSIFR